MLLIIILALFESISYSKPVVNQTYMNAASVQTRNAAGYSEFCSRVVTQITRLTNVSKFIYNLPIRYCLSSFVSSFCYYFNYIIFADFSIVFTISNTK